MDFADFSISRLLASLIGVVFMTVMAASCLMWVRAAGKLIQGQPLLEFEPRRRVPWGLFDLLLVFLVMICVVVAMQWVVAGWSSVPDDAPPQKEPPSQLALAILASSTAMLLGCGVAVIVLRFRTGATWEDLGFRARDFVRDLRIGGAAFLMLAPPMYLLQFGLTKLWFKSEHPVQKMMLDDPNASVLLTALFTAVIVAPLTEEIFFRVIFQGWLESLSMLLLRMWRTLGTVDIFVVHGIEAAIRAVLIGSYDKKMPPDMPTDPFDPDIDPNNPYAAMPAAAKPVPSPADDELNPRGGDVAGTLAAFLPIAISAEIFALLHASHGPDPIALLFLALGLGYVYQRTHRATPCIVVHFLVNGLSTLALLAYLLGGAQAPR